MFLICSPKSESVYWLWLFQMESKMLHLCISGLQHIEKTVFHTVTIPSHSWHWICQVTKSCTVVLKVFKWLLPVLHWYRPIQSQGWLWDMPLTTVLMFLLGLWPEKMAPVSSSDRIHVSTISDASETSKPPLDKASSSKVKCYMHRECSFIILPTVISCLHQLLVNGCWCGTAWAIRDHRCPA